MKKVGIAGGIGSGKSGIAKAFATLGVPVYFADDEAKRLMKESDHIREALINEFGNTIYKNDQLQKAELAKIIFSDKTARQIVNGIVHPAVRNDFLDWAENCQTDLVMIEAAIMFDTGFYKFLDATILVLADEEQRIRRVTDRDGINTEAVKRRMAAQTNPEKHKTLATFLINNNDEDEVLPQLLYILKKLRNNG